MPALVRHSRFRQGRRSAHGHNVIEFGCVALMLAVVSVLSADIGIVMLADSTNERACRDAARAAAQASDSATAMKMASAALNAHKGGNIFITSPQLDASAFQYNDFASNPPPDTSPYVEVATYVTVKVPAPVFFGNAEFNPNNGQIIMRKAYTFPIVKTQLYLN